MAKKNFKLSAPRSRTDNIARFRSLHFEAYPWDECIKDQLDKGNSQEDAEKICGSIKAENDSKLADEAPAAPSPDATGDDDTKVDTEMTTAISALEAALANVQALQAKDPDGDSDPNDVKVTDALGVLAKDLDALKTAQDADDQEDSGTTSDKPTPGDADSTDAPAPKLAKLAVENTTPVIDPADKDGNVDDDAACGTTTSTGQCNHLASAHNDTDDGENTGACTMKNCDCEGFTANVGTPSDPEGDDADGSGDGGANNAGGGDAPASDGGIGVNGSRGSVDLGAAILEIEQEADNAAADATQSSVLDPLAPPDTNAAPEITGSDLIGIAFTIPVGVIEGQETGDGRGISVDAITWGNMPLPLMGLATATHDPMGFDQNDPSIICGRIDNVDVKPGENGTQIVWGSGYFLDNDDGNYFADLVKQMGRVGVSADITANQVIDEVSVDPNGVPIMDDYGFPIFTSRLTAGTLDAFTIVPFPAFSGCYIVVGDGTVIPDIPKTVADSMQQPEAVTAGGQLIHFIAKADCVPCATGFSLVASGAIEAPMQPPKSWFENPDFAVGDGRLREIFTGRGNKRMGGSYACPLTITESGEVFGHIAAWGVCHMGDERVCTTAPHSKANYAHFKRAGQQVKTAEGTLISIGVLTVDTGHASQAHGFSPAATMAHYDNTGTQFAQVEIGEDDFGIWVHGALMPELSELQLRRIRASSPSGDWRWIGGNYELVASLNVNQPGFPISTIDDGTPASLVAAGAYQIAELAKQVDEVFSESTDPLYLAVKPMLEDRKVTLRQKRLELAKADAKVRLGKALSRR